MSRPIQRGLHILGLAAILGVLGDILLRTTPWGVNLSLWVGMACAAGWLLLPESAEGRLEIAGWPLLAALFFAFCFAWRDAESLLVWNGLAILCALSLPALKLHGIRLRAARITDYVMGLVANGLNAVAGPTLLPREELATNEISRHSPRARAAVLGLILAVPVLFVFGGLLMSADPGFERIVRALIDWDFEIIASHIALVGFLAWTSTGVLRPLAMGRNPVLNFGDRIIANAPKKPMLGIVELGIPLGALGLIFLVFAGLQARYLFGGEAVILQTAGLTYAEYARGGFFQVVAVATLLLPLLLGADWLLDGRAARNVTRFRIISATLLLLIALIVLSAILRMRLYMDTYGLTEDRFYAMAFLVWVGMVLALFGTTVLRGRRDRFAFGAIATGFVTLATLNIVNPDAVIARTNLTRAEAGAEFDVEHAKRLSADAIPELVTRAPALLSGEACESFWKGLRDNKALHQSDWRTWNRSRRTARRAIQEAAPPNCG